MKNIAVSIETSRAYGRALMEGVAAYAQEAGGWRLRSVPGGRLSASRLKAYDGIILRLSDEQTARAIARAGIPAVDVYGHGELPIADGNHEKTGRMAAAFFLKRNFRNFAWCGIDGLQFSDRRGNAFATALAAAGHDVHRYVRPKRIKADSTLFYDERLDRIPDAVALTRWVRTLPLPIAVFCCHDYRAYQLMLVAADAGLQVPKDIAILGVDNDTTLCSFAPIPLSSIDPNAFKVGYAAARMLNSILDGEPVKPKHRPFSVTPDGIVERESTEFIPTDQPWLSDALVFIEKNLPRGIAAADVFSRAGKSSTYVERIFRRDVGMPVQEYINAQRIARAKELLRTTNEQVKAVAGLCGFSSAQYFCRAFLARVGQTPNAYRMSGRA